MKEPISEAEQLIRKGERVKAKELLMQTLQADPGNGRLCQSAVNVFLYGDMYEEAKWVFELYKRRTGKDLGGDFSLKEIERLAGCESVSVGGGEPGVKIFKRLSFRELLGRGSGPAVFSVNEIRIHPDKIVLRKRRAEYSYPWSEITRISLTRKPIQTQYANFIRKSLYLRTLLSQRLISK